MNGERVGTLHRAAAGAHRFEYADSWLQSERATPISVSMPLSENPYRDPTVSNFFDNLLPDDGGARRRIQSQLGAASDRPFDLLSGIGGDCVGALQLFETQEPPDVRRLDTVSVSDSEIAEILRNLGAEPLGIKPDKDNFRISLAGVHDKTALLRLEDQWCRPQGPTPTSHILKLPIGLVQQGRVDLRDSVENEWLCLRILKAFGLVVPEASIESFEDIRTLVVERFDRGWSADGSWLLRLPCEDMCQALGISPGEKYEVDGGPGIVRIMELLWQSTIPDEDRTDFFKASVLYWMLGAIDGHAKNFSLALRPRGRCSLAPLYDVVSAYPAVARKQLHPSKLNMAMSVVGKRKQYAWERIQRRHWLATAKAGRLSAVEAERVLNECIENTDLVVSEVGASLPEGFPDAVATPILQGLRDTAGRLR